MRIYLNEGNDIKNAAQMVDAMRSSGVVSGLHVTLCEMENPRTSTNVKFDGVSGCRTSNMAKIVLQRGRHMVLDLVRPSN